MPAEERPGGRAGTGQLSKVLSRTSITGTSTATPTPCCSSSSSVSSVGAGTVEGQAQQQDEGGTTVSSRSQVVCQPEVNVTDVCHGVTQPPVGLAQIADTRADSELQAGSEVRVASEAQVHSETRARTDSRAGSYSRAFSETRVGSEARANSDSRADPDVRASSEMRTRTGSDVRLSSEMRTRTGSDVRLSSEMRTRTGSDARARSEIRTRTGSDVRLSSEMRTRTGSDVRLSSEMRTRTGSDVRASSDVRTRTGSDVRTGSDARVGLASRAGSVVQVSCSDIRAGSEARYSSDAATASPSSQPVLCLQTLSSRLPNLSSDLFLSGALPSSPESTPTVTISRRIPSVCSVRPGISSASLASSSPPLGATSLVASICSTLPSPSLVPSLSPARLLRRLERSAGSNSSNSSSNSGSSSGSSDRRRGGRVPHLALTHLAASESVPPPFLHSPPPSYDQLCNPNALPTYQEATRGSQHSSGNSKQRRGDHQHQWTVYTLPSSAPESAPIADPIVQEGDRSQRLGVGGAGGGGLASLAAELSDSEGGYSTILDAIPHEHPRDPRAAPVPVTFLSPCPPRRLRPPAPAVRPPCFTSVCNKALVRKELNRRWPFIAGAREDAACPGLLLVQCSSHLTVAHLPDVTRPTEGGGLSVGGDLASLPGDTVAGLNLNDLATNSPTVTSSNATAIDLESGALTSRVVFYLCGKCVGYDSFDRVNVRAHIEFDCPGPRQHHAELYLVLRAVLFVAVVIGVFLWLPYLRP